MQYNLLDFMSTYFDNLLFYCLIQHLIFFPIIKMTCLLQENYKIPTDKEGLNLTAREKIKVEWVKLSV